MSQRLPVRPPPRALHWVGNPYWPAPLCGSRPRGALHVTTNRLLVTCPKCRQALVAHPDAPLTP